MVGVVEGGGRSWGGADGGGNSSDGGGRSLGAEEGLLSIFV